MWTATDIRSLRQELGETQTQFAQRLHVDQSTLHRWEVKGLPRHMHELTRRAVEAQLDEIRRGLKNGEAAA